MAANSPSLKTRGVLPPVATSAGCFLVDELFDGAPDGEVSQDLENENCQGSFQTPPRLSEFFQILICAVDGSESLLHQLGPEILCFLQIIYHLTGVFSSTHSTAHLLDHAHTALARLARPTRRERLRLSRRGTRRVRRETGPRASATGARGGRAPRGTHRAGATRGAGEETGGAEERRAEGGPAAPAPRGPAALRPSRSTCAAPPFAASLRLRARRPDA